MIEPDIIELEKFWQVIKPYQKEEYVEIRFTDSKKPRVFYDKIKQFGKDYPSVIVKKGSQLFLQDFNDLLQLLLYDNCYFNSNYKICYGINNRFMDSEGELAGGYDYLYESRFAFFDIDKKDHSSTTEEEQVKLDSFIKRKVAPFLSKFGLKYPILVNSGSGRHLLYRIPKQIITDGRRRWFREFSIYVSNKLENEEFDVDAIYDLTRVFALPSTFNVKRNKKVELVLFNDTTNSGFKLKTLKAKKFSGKTGLVLGTDSLENSLELQVLLHNAPQGNRHNIVVFALKLLMRELGISDVSRYEQMINQIYGGSSDLDPFKGTEGKVYTPGIIINYCKNNWEWVKNHPKLVELYDMYTSKKLNDVKK